MHQFRTVVENKSPNKAVALGIGSASKALHFVMRYEVSMFSFPVRVSYVLHLNRQYGNCQCLYPISSPR